MPQMPRSSAHFIPHHRFEGTADFCGGGGLATEEAIFSKLERRLGRLHANLRLGIETDHEAQIFGQGINFFHIENWYSIHSIIRTALKLMGLYWRGCKNAEQVRHNHISTKKLPSRFAAGSPAPSLIDLCVRGSNLHLGGAVSPCAHYPRRPYS